jgi:hypothetical protein
VPFLYQLVENHFQAIQQIKCNNSLAETNNVKVVASLITATSLVPRVIIDAIVNKLSKDPDVMPEGNPRAEIRKHTKLRFKVIIIIRTFNLKKNRENIYFHNEDCCKYCHAYYQGQEYIAEK